MIARPTLTAYGEIGGTRDACRIARRAMQTRRLAL